MLSPHPKWNGANKIFYSLLFLLLRVGLSLISTEECLVKEKKNP